MLRGVGRLGIRENTTPRTAVWVTGRTRAAARARAMHVTKRVLGRAQSHARRPAGGPWARPAPWRAPWWGRPAGGGARGTRVVAQPARRPAVRARPRRARTTPRWQLVKLSGAENDGHRAEIIYFPRTPPFPLGRQYLSLAPRPEPQPRLTGDGASVSGSQQVYGTNSRGQVALPLGSRRKRGRQRSHAKPASA